MRPPQKASEWAVRSRDWAEKRRLPREPCGLWPPPSALRLDTPHTPEFAGATRGPDDDIWKAAQLLQAENRARPPMAQESARFPVGTGEKPQQPWVTENSMRDLAGQEKLYSAAVNRAGGAGRGTGPQCTVQGTSTH